MIWHQDIRHPQSRSRQIAAFHTPEALSELLDRDFEDACDRLGQLPNDHPRLRPYQVEANAAVEQAITDRKRHMLVRACLIERFRQIGCISPPPPDNMTEAQFAESVYEGLHDSQYDKALAIMLLTDRPI